MSGVDEFTLSPAGGSADRDSSLAVVGAVVSSSVLEGATGLIGRFAPRQRYTSGKLYQRDGYRHPAPAWQGKPRRLTAARANTAFYLRSQYPTG
jgi:hypothetical protein